MIYSGLPSLCELDEFANLLKDSWSSGILSNNGPLLQELEKGICRSLDINQYIAVANGTIALQLAIEALEIKGTILVPSFSWIASAAAVSWQKCNIKYCDIDSKSLNICTNSIENNINSSVEAIMPVHVFGNPCDVEALSSIAKKYNLKLIYDAAHAFGTTFNGKSILSYGDISCVSTHATKIFNTAEGGGLISNSNLIADKIKSLRFFGLDANKNVISEGINGKMSEVHAALGIANLKYLKETISHRRLLNNIYRSKLGENKSIKFQEISEGSNCAYFPIIFEDESICLSILELLVSHDVFPKRYFYPSLNKIKPIKTNDQCPVAESLSKRILCLPSHNGINLENVAFISSLINNGLAIYK